jgi:hypothetical protein
MRASMRRSSLPRALQEERGPKQRRREERINSMATDHIRYDILAQEALRGVVRQVLVDVAKNGLPGKHHFYISFDTRADGVRLSKRMLAQYPEEMTIVLQHQFWDLVVTETDFEIGLSFGGIPERLAVPFAAVKGFFDPSVEFGLQFEETADSSGEAADTAAAGSGSGAPAPPAEHTGTAPVAAVPAPANLESAKTPAEEPAQPAGGGEVVRLDRFRKK